MASGDDTPSSRRAVNGRIPARSSATKPADRERGRRHTARAVTEMRQRPMRNGNAGRGDPLAKRKCGAIAAMIHERTGRFSPASPLMTSGIRRGGLLPGAAAAAPFLRFHQAVMVAAVVQALMLRSPRPSGGLRAGSSAHNATTYAAEHAEIAGRGRVDTEPICGRPAAEQAAQQARPTMSMISSAARLSTATADGSRPAPGPALPEPGGAG